MLAAVLGFGTPAAAQGIESVLAPGKVIADHAKVENDCAQCHVRFDRKAQDGLCMACHKDVGSDVRTRTGFHGRQKPQACNSCHTDHKGREAKIVQLDKSRFDHSQTDFALRGKHPKVDCEKCHVSGKRFRDASLECQACHRKDDVHKGSLGVKCAECHNESNWKESSFDHGKTRFALSGRHAEAKCADCHRKNVDYKETPRTCVGCHRQDDDRKGHKGQFGEKCESCHGNKAWKPSTFNHDSDTRYALRGKHRTATCLSCHKTPLYRSRLSEDCYACHKADDKHKESLGRDCGSCHTERGWKEPARFNHDQSSFPLLGKHAKVECKECHKSAMFKDAPKDCLACHRKDDRHEGTLGAKCGDCHSERDWKSTEGRFDHDRTRFRLRNAHARPAVKCQACHKDLRSFRDTALECYGCHRKDDKHEGDQGRQCEQCHSDRNWKVEKFDHSQTRFPLTGLHVKATCKSCHETSRYKGTPRDCYSCHKKEDRHKLKFGVACESCHNARAWSIWDYDHAARARYALDGGHQKVACESCHRQPAPAGKSAAPTGTACSACHLGDDVHDRQFGIRCEQCHVTQTWKKVTGRMGLAPERDLELVAQMLPVLGASSHFNRGTRDRRAGVAIREQGT